MKALRRGRILIIKLRARCTNKSQGHGQNKMKKVLVMLLAVLGMSISLMADTTSSCKISGGSEGATVVASIIEVGDGYVMVELDNDGSFAVNVTVKISGAHSGQRACKVSPQMSNTIKVPVPAAKAGDRVTEYNVSLSGSRCK